MSYAKRTNGHNHLLASLSASDRAYLTAIIRVEHPPRGRILSNRSERSTDIWFPHTGLVALSVTDAEGHSVHAVLVGSEGCVGIEAVLDRAPSLADATVQVVGDISVISMAHFRAALEVRPSIREAMLKYLYGLSAQLVQGAACDRLHSLERRCCRALLHTQDSTGSDALAMTQESLAALLGGGRPRINKVLGSLERKGLLRRHRGRISLLSRRGLEEQSCDCYRIVRRVFDSLGIPAKRSDNVA